MDVKKMLVQSVVDRAIRDIKADPKRAIRRLLDLGQQNTHGGFRSRFLQFSAQTLEDESSPYYQMVSSAISQIDRETLKSVGVNFGYHCWSKGTQQLRSFLAETGIALPWNVTFHFDRTTGAEQLRRCGELLDLGQARGVYCYSFMLSEGFSCAEWLTGLMLAHSECVFFLFLPQDMSAWDLEHIHLVHNAVTLVSTDGENWMRALNYLGGSGCMSGVYRRFSTEEDVEEIESGRWLDLTAGAPCLCAMALAGPAADDALCDRVRAFAERCWSDPAAPTFMVDYYRDLSLVSEVITGTPVFLGVEPDGSLTCSDGRRELPGEGTLQDLLASGFDTNLP